MIADLEEVRQPSPTQRRRGGTTAWILQVVSGVRRGQAWITYGVTALGAVTAAYSFWLIATLAANG